MDLRRHPGALAAQDKTVAGAEGAIVIASLRPGSWSDKQAAAGRAAAEGRPVQCAGDQPAMVAIIHAGPAHAAVVQNEPAGFDDMHRHPEAGGEAQDGAGVLGNVGLVQDQAIGAGKCSIGFGAQAFRVARAV